MKFIKTYLFPLLFAASLIYIMILRECQHPVPCPQPDTVTVTRMDTLTVYKHYPKPAPDQIIDSVWTWMAVDTAAILAECQQVGNFYNSTRIYNRRFDFDSCGYVDLTDTVRRNLLQGYEAVSHLNLIRQTQIITRIEVPKPRIQLHAGAVISYGKEFGIVPTAALLTKKKHLYSIGYDPFGKKIFAGGFFRLY